MIDAVFVRPLVQQNKIELRITNGLRDESDGRAAGPRTAWMTEEAVFQLIHQLLSSVERLRVASAQTEPSNG